MCDKLLSRAASLSTFVSTQELDAADVRAVEIDASHVLLHVVLAGEPGEPRREIYGDEERGWVLVSCDGRAACCEMVRGAWSDTLFYCGLVPVDTGCEF